MNRRYKGEENCFWLFLICIFMVLPLGKKLIDAFGVNEKTDNVRITDANVASVDTSSKMTNRAIMRGAQEIEVTSNHANAPVNKQVKFKLSDETVKIVLTSPDDKKVSAQIKSPYGYFKFEVVGGWEVEGYDQHGLIVDWFKINIY